MSTDRAFFAVDWPSFASALCIRLFRWLPVAAETRAHRRENLFRESMLLARAKTRKQRGCQNFCGNCLVDRRINGPAAFAGILDMAGVAAEGRTLGERRGGQIKQP